MRKNMQAYASGAGVLFCLFRLQGSVGSGQFIETRGDNASLLFSGNGLLMPNMHKKLSISVLRFDNRRYVEQFARTIDRSSVGRHCHHRYFYGGNDFNPSYAE